MGKPPTTISKVKASFANCKITVSKDTLNGEVVVSAILESILFFKITCLPIIGYCLHISNCYVSSSDTLSYKVIDTNGCSVEKDLFDDVVYLDDYIGYIRNPVPVKFRNSNDTITLSCDTKMRLKDKFRTCQNVTC
ncbi:Zona pellucida domain-containing protein [Strongyloides ratti]|uniref:Zona pellucida domain-containing protein n=1 Tax=Strongyloides ratti TaxID=34506 RepID=A0A090L350_STRRB|nr:Zona pellucida domain-containing protein [Strongyloides ratti]CEF64196.1 Zona pellucida domain-containing protein [Strongyloides ratti]